MSLSRDLARALDPVILARDSGFTPDAWQADVLRSESDRLLLNCSRQSGKSTTAGVIATHAAVYEPGSLTLLLSPSQRQSAELFRKVLDCFRVVAQDVPTEAESALRLELENGSRIISLPGKEATIRGFSGVDLLIVDEAARVEDTLYFSVRPMLAVSGGRLIAMSTPFGKRGWWHSEWESGSERWERIEIPATECPRISEAFLAEERATLGSWWFEQEYLCQFKDAADSVFSFEDIQAAMDSAVVPLFGRAAS